MIKPTSLFYLLAIGLGAHWISTHVNIEFLNLAHILAGMLR